MSLHNSIADDVKQKIFNICKSKEWEIIVKVNLKM